MNETNDLAEAIILERTFDAPVRYTMYVCCMARATVYEPATAVSYDARNFAVRPVRRGPRGARRR